MNKEKIKRAIEAVQQYVGGLMVDYEDVDQLQEENYPLWEELQRLKDENLIVEKEKSPVSGGVSFWHVYLAPDVAREAIEKDIATWNDLEFLVSEEKKSAITDGLVF